MNMNNMMMNNMNPMGMNIQPNLMNEIPMDETAQNIKSIIQPYENKIRELEEIILQKIHIYQPLKPSKCFIGEQMMNLVGMQL